jgi:hypothetical protein
LVITNQQIKSACNWEDAYFFVTSWDNKKRQWIVDETKQEARIQKLKDDTASNPEVPPNRDRWEN